MCNLIREPRLFDQYLKSILSSPPMNSLVISRALEYLGGLTLSLARVFAASNSSMSTLNWPIGVLTTNVDGEDSSTSAVIPSSDLNRLKNCSIRESSSSKSFFLAAISIFALSSSICSSNVAVSSSNWSAIFSPSFVCVVLLNCENNRKFGRKKRVECRSESFAT